MADTYDTADVIRAAGCSAQDLKNWLRRGYLVAIEPEETVRGRSRTFDTEDAIYIAIVTALTRAGLSAQSAAWAAARALAPGDADIYDAGKRFLLVVGAARFGSTQPTTAIIEDTTDTRLIRAAVSGDGSGPIEAAVAFVDLTDIIGRVCAALTGESKHV